MTIHTKDFHLVQLILEVNRSKKKNNRISRNRTEKDVVDVIDALHMCDYMIVSRGAFMALKSIIKKMENGNGNTEKEEVSSVHP